MKIKFLNSILFAGILSLFITSCIKDDVEDLGDAGRTFVKILEAPENQLFFEPFTGIKNVDLFSLRRDANSNAELNKAVTITVTVDTAAITAYNAANGTSFELLPDSLFTVVTPGVTKTGPLTYTIALEPGVFAKDFTIGLNGSKWDLSRVYSMPFVISDAGGLAISSDMGEVNTQISIKNKYDGRYKMTGTLVDAAVATITAKSPTEVEFHTIGPNSVMLVNSGTSIPSFVYFFPIMSGTSESAYGSFLPEFHFNSNDDVIAVTNAYGQPASNTRSAEIDPSGINHYDAATKKLQVKWFMKQPSVITAPPHIRTTFDFTFEYLGPR